jgi:hypothetical protein
MNSLILEMSKYFNELQESCCAECARSLNECVCESDEAELQEINVTGALDGGAGPPRVPTAFAKKTNKKTAEQLGYKQVQELIDSKYESIIESYRKFATDDPKTSPEQKVKRTIREVAVKLQEIEQLVNHSSRLKTESGLSRDGYGASVNTALTKIAERLTKISERVRALGE